MKSFFFYLLWFLLYLRESHNPWQAVIKISMIKLCAFPLFHSLMLSVDASSYSCMLRKHRRKKSTTFGFRRNFLFTRISSDSERILCKNFHMDMEKSVLLRAYLFAADRRYNVCIRLRWIIDAERFGELTKLAACSLHIRRLFSLYCLLKIEDKQTIAMALIFLWTFLVQYVGLCFSFYDNNDDHYIGRRISTRFEIWYTVKQNHSLNSD